MFDMKQNYEKPVMEQVEMDVVTTMMAESADTGMGTTPSQPDARGHRGGWGDLWGEDR